MPFMNVVRRHLFYPLWAWKNGHGRLQFLKQYSALQFSGREELESRQLKMLKEMLSHAYRNCPYYRKVFAEAGFEPADLRDFSDMRRLPLLSKQQIQENRDALVADGFYKESLIKFKTGGSTGTSLEVLCNGEGLEKGVGVALMCFGWAGWKIGEPMGRVWGNPPIPSNWKENIRDRLVEPIIWLDTMSLNDAAADSFARAWERQGPTLLHGHAHSLFMLAEHLARKGIRHIKPKGIVSTSMMLVPSERVFIEEVFGTKVTNLYGCEEVGLIACECEKHEGMHLNILNLFVEFIRDDGSPADQEEEGDIVVTSLVNFGMPIIRYRIEDRGIPASEPCSCGRGFPLMKEMTGRVADFLMKADGTLVAGISLIERTLTKIPGIRQMQIVQESLDGLVVNVVANQCYTGDSEAALLNELKGVFGLEAKVRINIVSTIKQERSGKYRFSICRINQHSQPLGLSRAPI